SLAMHWAGLRGAPRRSTFSEYGGADIASEWITYQVMQAVGGSFLFIAIIIAILLFLKLTTGPKVNDPEEFPVAMFMDQEEPVVKWVENWRLLFFIPIFLILIACTVLVPQLFTEKKREAKGFKLW